MAKQTTIEDYNTTLWSLVKLLGLSSLAILLVGFLIGVITGVLA